MAGRQADDTLHTTATASWLRSWQPMAESSELPPYFEDVSVHDPSIMVADGHYYIFGSHLAAARSDDLLRWQSIADGVNAQNPLFDNVVEELAETFAWAQSDTLWAADVIKLGDGRYYMYYNACKGDSPRSALGLAVADRPEGPYRNQGILLRSGMWDQISEDGRIYDARIHPNTVDPDVFFDAQGKLWMVYGSYSGGIFILQMDPASGRPLAGQGYGKHLMGGNHSRIEAPNISYNAQTGWYYLFTSFGGLGADGGYNLRVARSRNPDGPYLDGSGKDMSDVKSDPAKPLFDDVSIAPYAHKLIGNFIFERKLGEPGEGAGQGYISPGHNSVLRDANSGRWFAFFHTRFPQRGESFQSRVHELFFNRDGWPVLSPMRHAARPLRAMQAAEIAGDYKLIVHEKPIGTAVSVSSDLQLSSDGRVSGVRSGSWRLHDGTQLSLELDGTTYEGVLSWQWNETAQAMSLTFSASSREGITLWGSQLPQRSSSPALQDILADIEIPDTTSANLSLPLQAMRGGAISWKSSEPRWLDGSGRVTRPSTADGERVVQLTATATLRGASASRSFQVAVRPRRDDGLIAHFGFEGNLADSASPQRPASVAGALIDAPAGRVSYATGKTGKAAQFDGSSSIRLPSGLIQSNRYSVAFWLKPETLESYTPAFFAARDSEHWISVLPVGHAGVAGNSMLWSGNSWYDADLGMKIPAGRWSHVALSINAGTVQVYVDGKLRFSGKDFPAIFDASNGIFSLGANYWDSAYRGQIDELRIYETALDAQQVQSLANP